MNRRRQTTTQRNFVSGGILHPNTPTKNSGTNQQVNTQQILKEQQPKQEIVEDSMALDNFDLVDSNGKVKFKQIFGNRKKASSVRIKEKRIRQNRRLRKTIIPKNALMALHEIKGISIGDFTVQNVASVGFTASVIVNNIKYEGRGNSKSSAKNNACEKALRDFIIAKMREYPRIQKGASSNNSVSGDPMDTSNDDEIPNDDDDVPIINLASFAIFKLFSDWEREGYIIPELHSGGNVSENEGAAVTIPKKVSNRNDLPPNWEAMHPTSLLCVMRPGLNYVDKGSIGEKPNILQSLEVTVDDRDFQATGRAKKQARRNLAALVCNTLFNTNFELNVKVESNGNAH